MKDASCEVTLKREVKVRLQACCLPYTRTPDTGYSVYILYVSLRPERTTLVKARSIHGINLAAVLQNSDCPSMHLLQCHITTRTVTAKTVLPHLPIKSQPEQVQATTLRTLCTLDPSDKSNVRRSLINMLTA